MQETTFDGLTIKWELVEGDERDSSLSAGICDAEVTRLAKFIDKHGKDGLYDFVADPVGWAFNNYQDALDAIAQEGNR